MSIDDAVRRLRADPAAADLVRDAYLGADIADSARRFEASGEFQEVRRLLGDTLQDAVVVDLGAGSGIASVAFARHGAARVHAVEPDPSPLVGQGAIRAIASGLPIEIVSGYGESIPLGDSVADIVYARQVLHHTRDLPKVTNECARILKPGGTLLACREHVADDEQQLAAFLAAHPMHQLAGGENAYTLPQYVGAIEAAGFVLESVLAPWDSLINAFPAVHTQQELESLPVQRLEARFGALGGLLANLRPVRALMWRRIARPVPGRMYSFLARKRGCTP